MATPDYFMTISQAKSSTNVRATFYCMTDCSASSIDDSRIQTLTDALAYLWSGSGNEEAIVLANLSGTPEPE